MFFNKECISFVVEHMIYVEGRIFFAEEYVIYRERNTYPIISITLYTYIIMVAQYDLKPGLVPNEKGKTVLYRAGTKSVPSPSSLTMYISKPTRNRRRH